MKPLYMRLKAFGPFAGESEVSFDRVFDGGLFLIHGRTGAGKTSLLDGLCFSLFGRPSSEEREKEIRGLRSDLAEISMMTETELVFAIGSEIYRVHRIPTQPTPKKRGEGFTEYKGSAELFKLDGSLASVRELIATTSGATTSSATTPDFTQLRWIPLAGKVEAVDEAVENLLGMNERQFRQVVVLPQGKFREFLSSTSSDRQTILEKLFQTDRFSRLQQFISSRARSSEIQYRHATQELQTKLEVLGLATVDDIEPRRIEILQKSEFVTNELADARLRSETLSSELNRAKELQRSLARLRDLEIESTLLESRETEIEHLKNRTTTGRLWLPFFQKQDHALHLEKKLNSREATRTDGNKSLANLNEKRTADAQALKLLIEKKPSLPEVANELIRLRSVAVLLKDIEKSATLLLTEESKNRVSRTQISDLEAKHATLIATRQVQACHLVRCDENLRAKEVRTLETEDLRIKELELRYHHSEASRLAALLSPDTPCPVCGSREHPMPAKVSAKVNGTGSDSVTEAEIQVEKIRFDQLRSEFITAHARRQSRLEPILHFVATAIEKVTDRSVDKNIDFESQFEFFQTTNREIETLAQSIAVLRTELKTRDENIVSSREAIEAKRKTLSENEQSYDEVVKRGIDLKAEQDSRETEIQSLENRIAAHDSEISRLNGAMQALDEELAALRAELSTANSDRDHARPETSEPPARTTETELRADEIQIENYTAQKIKVSAALSEVQNSIAQHVNSRALEAIQFEFDMASARRTELEQSAARLLVELEALSKLKNETASDLDRLHRLKSETERGVRMSQLLTGNPAQNKLLVPLSRFVLQSRFDEVLEQANRRLGRMSRGQFQLRRPALSRNLRDSQGLEIRVEDANAGTERHAGSLSGGESFMAALSLALGLADVVQADLGGIKLDSVMIDEGFGTLDSESLDLALKTLLDLQAGGRIVGIISHVQEIKAQVPHRLEVKKQSDGSAILWNVSN